MAGLAAGRRRDVTARRQTDQREVHLRQRVHGGRRGTVALLAVRGGARRIGVDVGKRRRIGEVAGLVAGVAGGAWRHRDVVRRQRDLVEVADIEALVAVGAVRAEPVRGGSARVQRILCTGRPVDHGHADPAHAGLVTGLAVVGDTGVVHRRAAEGLEVRRRVAGLAGLLRRHVLGRLARGDDVVVAAGAVAGYAGVVVGRGLPGQVQQVAGAALGEGLHMLRALADRRHVVVTAAAGADDVDVVEHRHRLPRERRVALGAVVGGQDVADGLRARAYARARSVTGEAVGRRALEDAADVAALARHLAVPAEQFEAGGEMVEAAGLGVADARAEQRRDAEDGASQHQAPGPDESLRSAGGHGSTLCGCFNRVRTYRAARASWRPHSRSTGVHYIT